MAREQRKLAAILAADVVGYSQLTEAHRRRLEVTVVHRRVAKFGMTLCPDRRDFVG